MLTIGTNELWFFSACAFLVIAFVLLLVSIFAFKNKKLFKILLSVGCILPILAFVCVIQLSGSKYDDSVAWKNGSTYQFSMGKIISTMTIDNGKCILSSAGKTKEINYTENGDGSLKVYMGEEGSPDTVEVTIHHYPVEDVITLTSDTEYNYVLRNANK